MDSEKKSQGVMTALKGRSSLEPKGDLLLGIVQKLSEKRKALGGEEKPAGFLKPSSSVKAKLKFR
jgi:hypothetical protein